jgi:hypothetical protein
MYPCNCPSSWLLSCIKVLIKVVGILQEAPAPQARQAAAVSGEGERDSCQENPGTAQIRRQLQGELKYCSDKKTAARRFQVLLR